MMILDSGLFFGPPCIYKKRKLPSAATDVGIYRIFRVVRYDRYKRNGHA